MEIQLDWIRDAGYTIVSMFGKKNQALVEQVLHRLESVLESRSIEENMLQKHGCLDWDDE